MSHYAAARVLHRPSFSAALGDEACLRSMLAFESALARAQAEAGVIPGGSADAIEAAALRAAFDMDALVAAGKRSASLAVPLVEALRSEVGRYSKHAAIHVHFGATSQDVLDTALALAVRACLDEADSVLRAAVTALVAKARAHRTSAMLGRTLMQPAMPITAGLKIARWAHALDAERVRLARSRALIAVQLGGPVGALESMGGRGPAVRAALAQRLGLADGIAWHAHRGNWLELVANMSQAVVVVGKIALDLALLSQAEVAEMREAPEEAGVGGSSAMAHKRNPVACAHALAAATRAPALLASIQAGAAAEHERALGGWQAELDTVADLAHALGTSLDFVERIGAALVVDASRMKKNLEARVELPATDAPTAAGLDAALEELLREIER
jgi:3-carboxy-cis,cis-muconate cycloisomerase